MRIFQNVRQKSLRNQLIEAVKKGDVVEVGNLLQAGANPTMKEDDINGQTPLHYAVLYSYFNPQIITKMLEKVDNPFIQDNNGNTPLHLLSFGTANVNERDGIVRLLFEKENKTNCIGRKNIHPTNIKNNKSEGGRTALHIACMEGRVSLIPFLLDRGADPFIKDTHGRSVLEKAGYVSNAPNPQKEIRQNVLNELFKWNDRHQGKFTRSLERNVPDELNRYETQKLAQKAEDKAILAEMDIKAKRCLEHELEYQIPESSLGERFKSRDYLTRVTMNEGKDGIVGFRG